MATSAKEAFKRLEAMKQKRQNYDQHWQELADYFMPSMNTITRTITPGTKRELHLYDSTGVHSCELLAGALHSMLTNPSSYWFEFTTGDPVLDRDDDVRMWLQHAQHKTHEVLNASNFQTEIHELYLGNNVFGTAVMGIEEDEETIIRFRSKFIRDCYIAENNKGFVDILFHPFKWHPRLIIQEFGEKVVPKFVLEASEKSPDVEMELLQVVEPNRGYSAAKKLDPRSGKKFASCTYMRNNGANETLLEEKGFDTFPYVTPRWAKASGEIYGYSPSMKSLCDVKMINEMMKEHIRAQQKANNPPLLAPDDGIVGHARLVPGGITYYRSGTGDFIKPLESGQNLKSSQDTMDDVRSRIRTNFYIDQLQLQDGPQMTATEVMQRTEEKIRMLGPLLGRQHSELLRPMIDRVFDIMLKNKGLLDPYPQVLAGRKIDVKYRSMLAKAQLQSEAQNLTRVVQAAAPFIQMDQNAADMVDADAVVKYVAEMYGLPQELLRTQKQVQDIRQAKQQAAQQAQQASQEQMGVDQAAKLAPAVKIAHDIKQPVKQ